MFVVYSVNVLPLPINWLQKRLYYYVFHNVTSIVLIAFLIEVMDDNKDNMIAKKRKENKDLWKAMF